MSEEIKTREFWLIEWFDQQPDGFLSGNLKTTISYDVETSPVDRAIHVIEHSAYLAVKQELDAARLKHKEKELNLEGLIANRNKQLTDAKAQIADYEAALVCAKETMEIQDIVCLQVEQALNKWSGK